MNFSFMQGLRDQPLQFVGGYNRNSLDFSRPLSSFAGGYNQQMNPMSAATQEPIGGHMDFNPPAAAPVENARQLAPSLLALPGQKSIGFGMESMDAQGSQAKAEMMSAQGSPMLSQVPQIGGRYQRKFQGLLG